MIALEPNAKNRPEYITVRVRRQDGPGKHGYWETHRIKYEPELNVISVLQRIAAHATTADGKKVPPVVWDCGCLGRGLRLLHDADQRPRPSKLQRFGRQAVERRG